MKKILTFLVMLFATVSILSAQAPKFNYQAVVRDINNDLNLVVDKVCTVEVEIREGETIVHKEVLTDKTNRNGMISLVIGTGALDDTYKRPLDSINWSNASINSTFEVDGETVSLVQTPVMAVPYALQAKEAPLNITTKAICDYIATMDTLPGTNDVDSILAALAANAPVWKYVKDTVYGTIKANYPKVKDLAIYFLTKATPEDVDAVYDTLSDQAKVKVVEIAKNYLKSDNGKAAVMDVLKYYAGTMDKEDAKALWTSLRNNEPVFDTLFNRLKDSLVTYIKNHKDIAIDIAKSWLSTVTTGDIQAAKDYLQTNESELYDFVLGKFKAYFKYYLENVFYAVSDSCTKDNETGRINICAMADDVAHLQGLACPMIKSVVISQNLTADNSYNVVVTMNNVQNESQINSNYLTYAIKDGHGEPISPIVSGSADNKVSIGNNTYEVTYTVTTTEPSFTFVANYNNQSGCTDSKSATK